MDLTAINLLDHFSVQRPQDVLLQRAALLGVRRRPNEGEGPEPDGNRPPLDALPQTHQRPVQVDRSDEQC